MTVNIDRLIFSLIVFQNRHISGALAELIRSTRAPTKDRLIGKIMGGNPAFRGTRVPVHLLAELCPRACAQYPNTAQGLERWLASVRAELLPALPACGAPRTTHRQLRQPYQLPLYRPGEETAMSD